MASLNADEEEYSSNQSQSRSIHSQLVCECIRIFICSISIASLAVCSRFFTSIDCDVQLCDVEFCETEVPKLLRRNPLGETLSCRP